MGRGEEGKVLPNATRMAPSCRQLDPRQVVLRGTRRALLIGINYTGQKGRPAMGHFPPFLPPAPTSSPPIFGCPFRNGDSWTKTNPDLDSSHIHNTPNMFNFSDRVTSCTPMLP